MFARQQGLGVKASKMKSRSKEVRIRIKRKHTMNNIQTIKKTYLKSLTRIEKKATSKKKAGG